MFKGLSNLIKYFHLSVPLFLLILWSPEGMLFPRLLAPGEGGGGFGRFTGLVTYRPKLGLYKSGMGN